MVEERNNKLGQKEVKKGRFFRDIEGEDFSPESNHKGDGNFFKFGVYGIIVLIIIFVGLLFMYAFSDNAISVEPMLTCGDSTFYAECSLSKPYYCSDGMIIRDPVNCGCPEILDKEGSSCMAIEFGGEREVAFRYFLDGEERFLSMIIYDDMMDYLSTLPRALFYKKDEVPRRDDFKLMKMDDSLQREALMPLVVAIQNTAPNSIENQARMAISLVQNIIYGEPEFMSVLGGKYEVRLSRYPYQVLSEEIGSCEGKSELLAFLLRELGFEVALFHYNDENHESVGIKCPVKYSLLGSGYCFVETTVVAPIGYSTGNYLGIAGGKLRSEPEIVRISNGFSLPDEMDEYEDSMSLNVITTKIETVGRIDSFEKKKFDRLKAKYNL